MSSLFPSAIDGYSNIRVVRNNIEEILGSDHNSLRSATLNIERCLGINPQGPFGTVVERLDSSAQNIIDHASGVAPRHYDDHIDALVKTGTSWGLASGTVETQVQQLLDYENEFRATTGAGLVGATTFNTPGNEYSFGGLNVQDQIEEAGSFLDENANYLMRAFDSFVVSGMSVAAHNSVNLMVNVASGYVSGQGRLLHYDAQVNLVLLTAPGAGYYYVYAKRNVNTIEISGVSAANLSTVLDPENPIVLLSKIYLRVLPTPLAILDDIRKFGVSSSSKNGFSVGTKPTSGKDGYGCDFISLKAAVEYINALRDSGKNIGPSKITIISDLTISSTRDANIELPDGVEIDGCGNKISLLVDAGLFVINNNNIILKNIFVETNVSSFSGFSSLISITSSSSVKNLYINNIIMSHLLDQIEFFITCGANTLSDSIICNCFVDVQKGGIHFTSGDTGSGNLITGCSIFNNKIYQTPFSVSSYNGIVIGSNNKVYGNIIDGGFTYGIVIRQSNYGNSISDNTIIGYRSNVVSMGTGIYTNNSNNISITNNIIKGINTYGINCSSVDTLLNILVTGNSITNRDVSSTLPAATIGIFGSVNGEVSASNNMITYMKGSSIKNVKEIKNNYIVDHILGNTVNSIHVESCDHAVIESNYIKNSPGRSIYLLSCDNAVVNNNKIISPAYDSTGKNVIYIADCNYTNLSNNSILGSVGGGSSSLGVEIYASSYCNITNTFIYKLDSVAFRVAYGSTFCNFEGNYVVGTTGGFTFDSDCSNAMIKDNILIGEATYTALEAIYWPGASSLIANNYICGFGNPTATSVIKLRYSSDECIINGNYILNCFGDGIDCDNAVGLSICDNQFKMLTIGEFAGDGIISVGDNSLISNNIVSGYTGTYGISTTVVSGVKIIGNSFVNIGAGMTTIFYISSGSNTIEISDNYVLNAPGAIIDLNGADSCIVDNNIFLGDSSTSINAIQYLGSYCVVTNNIFKNIGFDDTCSVVIFTASSVSTIITGNLFRSYRGTAINCYGSSMLLIADNIIEPNISYSASGILGIFSFSNIKNNYFYGLGTKVSSYGIQINSSSNYLQIVGNVFVNIQSNLLAGIYFSGTGFSQFIMGNYMFLVPTKAIDLNSNTSSYIGNNFLVGNNTGSASSCLLDNVGANCGVINNVFSNSNKESVILKGTMIGCSNNYFLGGTNSSYGIKLFIGSTQILISGNYIVNYVEAIYSDSSSYTDVVISNNYINILGASNGIYNNLASSAQKWYINNNKFIGTSGSSITAIKGIGSNSFVSNNYIDQFGASDGYAILTTSTSQSGINIISNFVYRTDSLMSSAIKIGNSGSASNHINNNIIGTSGVTIRKYGIHLNGAAKSTCCNNIIYGNDVAGAYHAIYSASAAGSATVEINCIDNNFIVKPNGYGIYAGTFHKVSGNHIVMVVSTGKYGIYVLADSSVNNNYIMGGETGIYVSGVRVAASNNTVVESSIVGICAHTGCHSAMIIGNYIYQTISAIGIKLNGTNVASSIISNYISHTRMSGIIVFSSDRCIISNNYISCDTHFASIGIEMDTVTQSSVCGNHISNAHNDSGGGSGIYISTILGDSSQILISNNYIYESYIGINLYPTGGYLLDKMSVVGNMIIGSLVTTTGILLDVVTNRKLLLASNYMQVKTGAGNTAVSYSGTLTSGLQLIGNFALGGIDLPVGEWTNDSIVTTATNNVKLDS